MECFSSSSKSLPRYLIHIPDKTGNTILASRKQNNFLPFFSVIDCLLSFLPTTGPSKELFLRNNKGDNLGTCMKFIASFSKIVLLVHDTNSNASLFKLTTSSGCSSNITIFCDNLIINVIANSNAKESPLNI